MKVLKYKDDLHFRVNYLSFHEIEFEIESIYICELVICHLMRLSLSHIG